MAEFGIQWTPDIHVSYVTLPGNIRRFLLTGNGGIIYLLEGTALDDLPMLVNKSSKGNLLQVWGSHKLPEGKYGYSAIASVKEASDDTTDEAGYLVYAKGSPHNMVMRQFMIS